MSSDSRTAHATPTTSTAISVVHSLALPRWMRIASSGVFREAFDQGSGYAGTNIVLWPRRGAGACARLGVVASKRTFPKAVQRARAKRLIREAFRHGRARLPDDFDYVIIARRRILEARPGDVQRELARLAGRVGPTRMPAGDGGGA